MEEAIKAEYDDVTKEYTDSKLSRHRIVIAAYTFFQILGNPANLSFLELGCGDGFYSRELKRSEASNVLGVDISSEMVKLAQEKEEEERLGCKFMVHDVLTLSIPNQLFDVVVGVFVFNHAKNFEELKMFCRVAFQHLKPGGRFVGLNENPFDKPEYYESYRSYGVVKHGNAEREGDEIWIEFINPNGTSCKILNFYFPPERYAEAFKTIGFVDFQWHHFMLSPSEDTDEKRGNWKTFLDHPPGIGFSAYRPM